MAKMNVNQFDPLQIGYFQLLDFSNFLGGTTKFDFFPWRFQGKINKNFLLLWVFWLPRAIDSYKTSPKWDLSRDFCETAFPKRRTTKTTKNYLRRIIHRICPEQKKTVSKAPPAGDETTIA